MYSVDVHPDGTRFATAGGDGTVKIWSTGTLFGGKLLSSEGEGEEDGKKKKRLASSRFTENGNYVSSNTEDYDTSSSSEEMQSARQGKGKQPSTPQAAAAGVNDLTGLIRKKKGGKKTSAAQQAMASSFASAAAASSSAVNPFTSDVTAATSNNNEGPLSPLSRLTQRRRSSADEAVNPQSNNSNNNMKSPSKTHKLLCTISSHEGSVLCLRFSPGGSYLATAGDDSYVNIYARSNAPSLAKGNLVGVGSDGSRGNNEDVEHWNRVAICRGHHLDVVGLAWAPDDSHLVSCSLDSVHPVIVWKLYDVLLGTGSAGGGGGGAMEGGGGMALSTTTTMIHNLHPHKILGKDVHTSTVKGVAFDPAGKYIATSGDDPAICIWEATGDWQLMRRIDSTSGVFRSKKRKVSGKDNSNGQEEEEEDDPGELASLSLFRRISFAPDGTNICGTNATLRGECGGYADV